MKVILLLLSLIPWLVLPANPGTENRYPKNQFRSPVDFPLTLAGGFADPRKNHFHSGIDIRTGGAEGKEVRAIGDGYVTRIYISPGGFGKAIYINHPNGYTSVYAHLRGFNTAIGAYAKSLQYKNELFTLDTQVDAGVLKVKKGEVIAYSGNSGQSEGPHLHFEIRDAATQEIINPMLFGLPFDDTAPPKLYNVRIYPFDEMSMVNFSNRPVTLAVNSTGSNCRLVSKDTVRVTGNILFGIQALDFTKDSGSRDAISSVELYVDTTCYFSQKTDRYSFDETRYVNSLLDFPQLMKNGQRIMRSYIAPNNKLSLYGRGTNRGIVNFSDNRIHKVVYLVRDVFGNTSKLEFWVKSHNAPGGGIRKERTPRGTQMYCGKPNHFKDEGIGFDLPSAALYEDLDFIFSASRSVRGCLGPVYRLQDENTPLHTSCSLSLKADAVPAALAKKAVIVKVNESGSVSSRGGKMENGVLTTAIREFGDYSIAVDTVPPEIKPVNLSQNKNVSSQKSLSLKIKDNLSGIQYYRGTLNGKWILMDFDAKSASLVYSFDERLIRGKNAFRLVVRDAVGNETVYQAAIIR